MIPEFEGKHGHPILIGREMIEALLRASASTTARQVVHANQRHIFYLKARDPLVTQNMNSPQEYLDLQRQV